MAQPTLADYDKVFLPTNAKTPRVALQTVYYLLGRRLFSNGDNTVKLQEGVKKLYEAEAKRQSGTADAMLTALDQLLKKCDRTTTAGRSDTCETLSQWAFQKVSKATRENERNAWMELHYWLHDNADKADVVKLLTTRKSKLKKEHQRLAGWYTTLGIKMPPLQYIG